MLETFFTDDKAIRLNGCPESFNLAVPLPSKRGHYSLSESCYDFSNVIYPTLVTSKKQKSSINNIPLPPQKNLKSIMEEVQKVNNDAMNSTDLSKSQKEIVFLKNMENKLISSEFSKIFSSEYSQIAPLLINGNLDNILNQNKLEFNPFLNYKEMCKYLQIKLNKNLEHLKDKCLYVSMLENCINDNDVEKLDLKSILKSSDTIDMTYKILPQKEKKILKNSSCEN